MVTLQAGAARAEWPAHDARDTVRYGVFLRPDPASCAATAALHTLLRQQFGLVSAAVFPPHVTLLGNVALTGGEGVLLERVDEVAGRHAPVRVEHAGPRRWHRVIACDVHDAAVDALARDVEASLTDLRGRTDTDYLTGQTSTADFRAHLTIAGQDIALRPDLTDEVEEFVAAFAADFPSVMTARHVTTFRFESDHWPGRWWTDMTWQLLRSVPLTG